jgi:hypothetical protein
VALQLLGTAPCWGEWGDFVFESTDHFSVSGVLAAVNNRVELLNIRYRHVSGEFYLIEGDLERVNDVIWGDRLLLILY